VDIQKEPAEELEILEEAGSMEDDFENLTLLRAENGGVSSFPAVIQPFLNSIFPVLSIDRELRILYANSACQGLFTEFFNMEGNYFFDIFGRSFTVNAVREIRDTVIRGQDGYSWKGDARIKFQDRGTVQTRVYLFAAGLNVKDPGQFVVMFDDVTEENKRLLRSVYMSLLEASKLKDNDTGKHIVRVNYYSRCLAEALYHKAGYDQIDADFIDQIGFLASMHDVGKIGTPDDILNKEGPLNDWEWTIMKEHTKNGAFILSTYPNPMAKEIALSHHERWNGAGYPFQLEGDMIPLSARIVSIADVYDALRMKRSYKLPFDHEKTTREIEKARETQFDPTLVDVFLTISGKFDAIYEKNQD
jgi:putative two-component system response regulator